MAVETKRIFHISDALTNLNNMQIGCQSSVDADLGFKMWGGKDDAGAITQWLAKDQAARVTSLNISGLTAIASLVKTDGLGNLSAGQITIATLNSFLSDGPIPTCPVITADEVVYGGGSAGTPITSKNSFVFNSTSNYLGIGRANPSCGIHVGASDPVYVSGNTSIFATGDIECDGIYLTSLTPGSILFMNSSEKVAQANSNLYYTDTTFGANVTPTDDDATLDIIAAPVYSATGGNATINITATASGVANSGNLNLDSNGDALLHASDDLIIRSGAISKNGIFLNPDPEDGIRFQTPYTYSSWVKTYLPLAETTTEEATYVGNFGEASILDAMNQLYTLASAGGVSEPSGQVVYGTGTGVDSDANLIWSSSLLDITGKIRMKNAAWGTRTSASFGSNTITANFSTGKDVQDVEISGDVTDLNFTAPDNGDAKGLTIRITSTGTYDIGAFGGSPTTVVKWPVDNNLRTETVEILSNEHALLVLDYIDSVWYGMITVFEYTGA